MKLLIIAIALSLNINYCEADYLCRTVEAEAGICNMIEKQLVAEVILNRVSSDDFPNTITEVIEQPKQFSVYANKSVLDVEVTKDTIEAVKMAISSADGQIQYFCNYNLISERNKKWFDTLELIYEGMMRYYRNSEIFQKE